MGLWSIPIAFRAMARGAVLYVDSFVEPEIGLSPSQTSLLAAKCAA